jgi:hypothetical protein
MERRSPNIHEMFGEPRPINFLPNRIRSQSTTETESDYDAEDEMDNPYQEHCINVTINTNDPNPANAEQRLRSESTFRKNSEEALRIKFSSPESFLNEMTNLYCNQLTLHGLIDQNVISVAPHDFEILIGDGNSLKRIYIGNGSRTTISADAMNDVRIARPPPGSRCLKIVIRKFHTMNGGSKRRKQNKTRKYPKRIKLYSNPRTAQRMAHKYLGKTAKIYPANNPEKKYKIFDPKNNKWVNFGQMGYEDYTKHHDKKRRKNYLTRTKYMRGDWKRNPYSANNLSRHILW